MTTATGSSVSTGSKAIPARTPSHYLWQVWAEDCDEYKMSKEGVNKGRICYKCLHRNVSYFQTKCRKRE